MITTHELIAKLNESGVEFSVKYLHPNLYIINVDERYSNTENDQRIELFSAQVNIATQDFIELEHNSSIQLCLVTPEERNSDYSFLDEENKRHHWIEVLSGAKQENTNTARSFKTLHFYGYKGGQARSTVLGVLSKFLADQGYKILIIDADIEAPSLDKIFQTKTTRLSETLLGICHFRTEVSTANAYTQKNGKIDLIACRPDNETFDIDFSTFSLHTSLDPVILKNGLTKIGDFAESSGYDFVFIDHRTGISGSVIPLALSLPGPVISFARRDTQSLSGARIFKSLFNLNSGPPGIYVSFSLDPEFKRTGLSQEALKIQEELLMQFPEGFRADVEDAIDSYWIDWFHNKSLVSGTIPDIRKLNPENLSAIREISSVLGLSNEPPHLSKPETPPIDQPLTSSGSTDPGIYLEADFLKRLLSPNSPINYILGRKGTGKTRLVRELHARGLGRPILTAADYNHDGGIGSAAACFKTLVDRRRGSPQSIWCALLHAAIESNYATAQTLSMEESITKNIDKEITFQDIKTLLNDQNYQTDHFTFLVDGIETAFPSNEIKKNIESLFSFLLTIQSDSFLSQKITIRLFIRSDLAKNAIENIEQQLDGRTINLVWDEQSIFNFVLLRINQKSWFKTRFPEACEKLKLHEDRLKSGNITADEYEPLLMEFFPLKLRASNIQTITFLRTYFSDTVDSTYSPRLYDRFLEFLTDREKVRVKESEILESHRLGQKLISQAHQAASEYYLSEVSAELKYMLNPEVDIQKFTEGFNGLSTPFNVEVCVRLLHEKTRIETSLVRESMNIMKDIGMFELRPGFSEQWRVGRLFKSSLGMKYVRGTKLTSEIS